MGWDMFSITEESHAIIPLSPSPSPESRGASQDRAGLLNRSVSSQGVAAIERADDLLSRSGLSYKVHFVSLIE